MEGLITIFAPDAGRYLPGGTLSTLAAGGNYPQLAWVTPDESRSGLWTTHDPALGASLVRDGATKACYATDSWAKVASVGAVDNRYGRPWG